MFLILLNIYCLNFIFIVEKSPWAFLYVVDKEGSISLLLAVVADIANRQNAYWAEWMKTSVDEPEKKIYRTNSGLRIFGRVIRSRPSDVDIYIYIYTRPASPIIIALLELLACGTPVLRFHIPALTFRVCIFPFFQSRSTCQCSWVSQRWGALPERSSPSCARTGRET